MGQALVSYMQRNGANDTPIIPPVIPPADELEEETIEDWEPLELEDLEGKEYVEPFWTDQRNREKAARLAARKQRQEPTE